MVHPIHKIIVLLRVPKSTLHDHNSDRVRYGTISIPDLFLKAPESSTKSLNGDQPSVSNLLANTKAKSANTEANKSPNGAQLSITYLLAVTETMPNTQFTNSFCDKQREHQHQQ